MTVAELSRSTLAANKVIQHSHSPCVTPNYVVSKLDSFGLRVKPADAGLLKLFHQVRCLKVTIQSLDLLLAMHQEINVEICCLFFSLSGGGQRVAAS
jgi:hypothetical protein